MKIKNVRRKEEGSNIFVVTLKPNWFERLFGAKEMEQEYKPTGYEYKQGGQSQYVDRNGRTLGNNCSISQAIDSFIRSW